MVYLPVIRCILWWATRLFPWVELLMSRRILGVVPVALIKVCPSNRPIVLGASMLALSSRLVSLVSLTRPQVQSPATLCLPS